MRILLNHEHLSEEREEDISVSPFTKIEEG